MKPYNSIIPGISNAGLPFILIAGALAFLLGLFSSVTGLLGLFIACYVAYFFRDPERVQPKGEGLILSPADGVISQIVKIRPPEELGMGTAELIRVSVFLSIFDVHINRVPASGKVLKVVYRAGKFLNASLDKASDDNERNSIVMETSDGRKIAFVQIAGLIARRIVSDIKEGDEIAIGERFGLIRFGSRMDIYLPEGVEPLVLAGQRSVGGETVLAGRAEPGVVG